ncbi:hypothetical protein [Mesobacillus zeae]|uniref:Uncharacterized protein n=1 Tax=Mesobacillus zeae TaxID=1917180 RepID=A0A398BAK7_9BACI|nr:hypothetical protein [Mesobacillus zeae]RID84920.1 hypothetical protein D1970_11295 [Mesobacillus zeae]
MALFEKFILGCFELTVLIRSDRFPISGDIIPVAIGIPQNAANLKTAALTTESGLLIVKITDYHKE